jgi:hypothetical protein
MVGDAYGSQRSSCAGDSIASRRAAGSRFQRDGPVSMFGSFTTVPSTTKRPQVEALSGVFADAVIAT